MKEQLRNIPSVNELLESPRIKVLFKNYNRDHIKTFLIKRLDALRQEFLSYNQTVSHTLTKEDIKSDLIKHLEYELCIHDRKRIKKVINGTGIVLHTNMGRSPLPAEASQKISEIASGYCNLEYDLVEGQRGSRYVSIEELISKITGAESALVVNNNAAAVFLCLHTLANEKEVIVSRSEQVEIGGSFRIPDIINRSGAKMNEVGTTNKTYIKDYEDAITEDTRVLLKVHKSNFKIEGFTHEVQGKELVYLAKDRNLIVMEDVGSGVLVDLTEYGLPYEPTISQLLGEGIDIITFSGDKLLGGPQAGLIVGKKVLIDAIKSNPLTRMVRIDKLSLIALQEVLRLYLEDDNVVNKIPLLQMLTRKKEELLTEAHRLKELMSYLPGNLQVEIVEESDVTGGGALPGAMIQGITLAIQYKEMKAHGIQEKLREYKVPIIGRVKDNKLLLSLRTIDQKDYHHIVSALEFAFSKEEGDM